jgi:uncharacterized integral membrane protein
MNAQNSTPDPRPSSGEGDATPAPGGDTSGGAPTGNGGAAAPADARTGQTQPGKDPLRGSRASGAWVFVVVLVVLLTLLAIFVLQNTQSVEISFLAWTGSAPLAAALLIATAAGLLIAVTAGSLRILQLRRRVRRENKRGARV